MKPRGFLDVLIYRLFIPIPSEPSRCAGTFQEPLILPDSESGSVRPLLILASGKTQKLKMTHINSVILLFYHVLGKFLTAKKKLTKNFPSAHAERSDDEDETRTREKRKRKTGGFVFFKTYLISCFLCFISILFRVM